MRKILALIFAASLLSGCAHMSRHERRNVDEIIIVLAKVLGLNIPEKVTVVPPPMPSFKDIAWYIFTLDNELIVTHVMQRFDKLGRELRVRVTDNCMHQSFKAGDKIKIIVIPIDEIIVDHEVDCEAFKVS